LEETCTLPPEEKGKINRREIPQSFKGFFGGGDNFVKVGVVEGGRAPPNRDPHSLLGGKGDVAARKRRGGQGKKNRHPPSTGKGGEKTCRTGRMNPPGKKGNRSPPLVAKTEKRGESADTITVQKKKGREILNSVTQSMEGK